MKMIRLMILILIVFLFQHCDEQEQEKINPSNPMTVNLGNDTTIIYGDTLVLDAGTGFESYTWNDGISDEQQLEVTEAGTYWVEAINSESQIVRDTIRIDTASSVFSDTCAQDAPFFDEYSMRVPCSFSVKYGQGDDSYSFETRSARQDIVLSYERHATDEFDADTLFQIPEVYEKPIDRTYDRMSVVKDALGKEVGIYFYRDNSADFRNYDGFFLVKKDGYYVEILLLSYASSEESKLIEVLRTIKEL